MYSQGATILRPDLRGVVEEAFNASNQFIGGRALPPLPVPTKAGQYPVVTKATGSLLRNQAQRRGPGTNYARTTRSFTNDSYTCLEYGSEAIVPDDEAKDIGRFFDLERSETRWKYREIQLAHEIRAASVINDPATFSLTTSATAYTTANMASFDAGLDIDTAKQAIAARGENPEGLTAIMSLTIFNLLRASTRVQNRVRGRSSTDTFLPLDAAALAEALGLKEVLVGNASYDTSKVGASTSSMSAIWSNTYIWLGQCVQSAGMRDFFAGGTAYTLFWQEDADIFQVESYREEDIRSNVIRARQYTAEKVVNANTAQLLVTQYS